MAETETLSPVRYLLQTSSCVNVIESFKTPEPFVPIQTALPFQRAKSCFYELRLELKRLRDAFALDINCPASATQILPALSSRRA
jgi:hypothetical protein